MKLREFEGKRLFKRYGIHVPKGAIVNKKTRASDISFPIVLKAQVRSGNRQGEGGIVFVESKKKWDDAFNKILSAVISRERVRQVLAEEKISAEKEFYVAISYDTDTRTPVLSVSRFGGTKLRQVKSFPINILLGTPPFFLRSALKRAGFVADDIQGVSEVINRLYDLFIKEYALLAEINPLFKTPEGYVAGDAKVILDDERIAPAKKRLLDMGGDIAILASGGGASLLNIDALIKSGGRPANYTEYSGNPKSDVVKELTKRVLARSGLKGCWVVGGTANFTDIYETMKGFVEGLRSIQPKPTYPIVIRRDGPRQKEAFKMLKEVAANEGYRFYLFGSETPMTETAKTIVELSYGKRPK